MLFASLDSTIRNGYLNGSNFIFIDTVGFIRDLPTTLIDAFKSTLDEIINSDLILHVRDISDSQYLIHKTEVQKILSEIGIEKDDKRIVEVINKIDLVENKSNFHNLLNHKSIMISAKNSKGVDTLKKKILEILVSNRESKKLSQQPY